jgi:hypothetical protein
MTCEGALSAESLVELAGLADQALQTHDRSAAIARAEQLLDALFRHHRALRTFREQSDRRTADVLETETVAMIAETALTIGRLIDGGRWPDPLLRRHVEELIEVEVDRGVLSAHSVAGWQRQ